MTDTDHIIDSMPIPPDKRAPELDAAVRAALAAAAQIVQIYNKNTSYVKEKDDGSPITEADIASHLILTRELARTGHSILSEEATGEAKKSSVMWIVDPLDGTSDFVDRTGEFTIMVALVRAGEPVVGAIVWPTEHAIFVAQKNMGAYHYDTKTGWLKIAVSDKSKIEECRIVGSRHHLTDAEESFVKNLRVRGFLKVGSSLKACMIGAGKAEIYVTTANKIKEWDTAASHVIVAEAGGKMTDTRGQNITYGNKDVRHRHGIVITNGAMHDYIINKIQADAGMTSESD